MNMVISFSGRENGNCDNISKYIASKGDSIIYFRNLNIHDCSGCKYECFKGYCKYRQDDIYIYIYITFTKVCLVMTKFF